ncbi:glycoside hydrolase family 32 protein [Kribbella ginsengisoli]|uniref:Levanase n=1 Tax=Kribbella ginsengisoli TaxID=363865 RepID=A0ABP6YSY7_9ACTN
MHDTAAVEYPSFPYPVTNYQEDNRGQFHFSSRGGWMNDVNAPLYYRGVYHLYYQHAPNSLVWDTMHWGHATSTDLVHWQQKPIALDPGIHPGDLWSGGGVVDTGNVTGLKNGDDDPIVVFSGTNGVQVFYSLDGGNTFKTFADGKKVVKPNARTSRDPKVFWDPIAKHWGMVVWSDEGGNGADFYTSENLLDWTFGSRYQADWLFECPDMVRMPFEGGYKWVLSDGSGEYVVGDFDGTTFHPLNRMQQKINQTDTHAGGGYYAALTFANLPVKDRVVSMAWQGENQGTIWTGNATFPVDQRLKRTPDGPRVVSTPIPEIASARTSTRTWKDRTLDARSAKQLLAGVEADTYELEATVDVRDAERFGFRLHTSPDGWFDRDVVYDAKAQTLDGTALKPDHGKVKLRLLVDRGQLEVFGNDGDVYQSHNVNFDSLPGGNGLEFFVDGKVHVESLTLHELGSIWKTSGQSTLSTDIAGQWYPASGNWTDVAGGKQGQAGGDAFYLSKASGSDFTLEGDVKLVSGTAAALTFRANKDASRHYTANIDADAGVVKLWRPGRDIATHPLAIERGRIYHFKLTAASTAIEVWVDGTLMIDATDTEQSAGQFGLNVFRGTGIFQHLHLTPGS